MSDTAGLPEGLVGLRVLVVEDDVIIAMDIEYMLQELGCVVIGPVDKLDAAIRMAEDGDFDAAILDVNIRGGHVFPVAERLRARGVPFALASGYGDWALPEVFQNQLRLTKPFTPHELQAQILLLHHAVGAAHSGPTPKS